jgi:hypothetical protein
MGHHLLRFQIGLTAYNGTDDLDLHMISLLSIVSCVADGNKFKVA